MLIIKSTKSNNIDLTNLWKSLLKLCDFVTMPTTPTSAFNSAPFKTFRDVLTNIFTVPSNLAGLPTISIPFWYEWTSHAIGIQLLVLTPWCQRDKICPCYWNSKPFFYKIPHNMKKKYEYWIAGNHHWPRDPLELTQSQKFLARLPTIFGESPIVNISEVCTVSRELCLF